MAGSVKRRPGRKGKRPIKMIGGVEIVSGSGMWRTNASAVRAEFRPPTRSGETDFPGYYYCGPSLDKGHSKKNG